MCVGEGEIESGRENEGEGKVEKENNTNHTITTNLFCCCNVVLICLPNTHAIGRLCYETKTWNWLFLLFLWGSVMMWFVFMAIYDKT
jgi:hypothetical protein